MAFDAIEGTEEISLRKGQSEFLKDSPAGHPGHPGRQVDEQIMAAHQKDGVWVGMIVHGRCISSVHRCMNQYCMGRGKSRRRPDAVTEAIAPGF
jgi:hypothetical protein